METNDRNNNVSADPIPSPIQNFYREGCILVTGATGFVGKALVEKLLRSCPEINTIFILIRPKRGLDANTRFKELLKNPVFDRLRAENLSNLSKVVVVPGDVTEPGLGLSDQDCARLLGEVTVVFHSAATVRFNERLKDAVMLNTSATQKVVEFSSRIQNLKALVHVSTAYSNANRQVVDEIVYDPPANPQGIIHSCETLHDEAVEQLAFRLLKQKHPNTYTLTKAMAEWIVSENADNIPIAIVRPSIVTAAWKEPEPGWVDNVSGITGIMMEIGRGTIRSIICEQSLIVDIIPVDIVVNTLIAAAWHTFTFRSNSVRVYNCTSGSLNGIIWEELGKLTQRHALAVPTRYVQWYPGFSFRTNRFIHNLYHVLFHFLPAFCVDAVLRLQGAKPIMMKICDRFKKAAKTGEFFALHEWIFCCENQKSLYIDMTGKDQSLFTTDVSQIYWDDYVKQYMMGIRKFILKDSIDTLAFARTRLKRLYWVHRFAQFFAILLVLKIIFFR